MAAKARRRPTPDRARFIDECLTLYEGGATYDQIAATTGRSKSTCHTAVTEGLAQVARLDDHTGALARELGRLAELDQALADIMHATHWAQSGGRLIVDPDGRPVHDVGPVIQAAMGRLRVSERLARLLGLDAPAKARIEVVTEDVIDAAIRQLSAELEGPGVSPDRAGAPGETR